jgi:transcription elongation factor Elf1
MRDPFANYDAWLERPYQEQADREAHEEWLNENTTAECATCGHSFGHPDEVVLTLVEGETIRPYQTAMCPVCREESEVNIVLPSEPDDEYDGPDDYYEVGDGY